LQVYEKTPLEVSPHLSNRVYHQNIKYKDSGRTDSTLASPGFQQVGYQPYRVNPSGVDYNYPPSPYNFELDILASPALQRQEFANCWSQNENRLAGQTYSQGMGSRSANYWPSPDVITAPAPRQYWPEHFNLQSPDIDISTLNSKQQDWAAPQRQAQTQSMRSSPTIYSHEQPIQSYPNNLGEENYTFSPANSTQPDSYQSSYKPSTVQPGRLIGQYSNDPQWGHAGVQAQQAPGTNSPEYKTQSLQGARSIRQVSYPNQVFPGYLPPR